MLTDVLTRFRANECVLLVTHFNLDALSSNVHEVNSVINSLSHSFVPFLNLPYKGTA